MKYPKNRARRSDPVDVRFWSKVSLSIKPGACWPWRAALDASGYGRIGLSGRTLPAHRVAYELFVGAVPAGLVLDHTCRRRDCCNPSHLEPVSIGENVRRGEQWCRAKTHCKAGHPFSGDNLRVVGGRRKCATCRLAAARKYNLKRKSSA